MLLSRQWETPFGMFGRLLAGSFELWCLEPPWRDNEVSRSCIPEGKYLVVHDTFMDRYDNLAVRGVPGRTAIEFHRGNTLRDTEGCILPGTHLGVIGSRWGVIDSGDALEKLISVVPDDGTFLYVFGPGKCPVQSPSY